MNKKKNGWIKGLVIAVLIIGGLGAIGYVNREAIVDRFPWLNGTPSSSQASELPSDETSEDLSEELPSSEELELLQEWHLKVDKNSFFAIVSDDYEVTQTVESWVNLFSINALSKILIEEEVVTFVIPVEGTISLIFNMVLNVKYSQDFNVFQKDCGLYDFSSIEITENGQLLVPVYTPLYVE